MATSSHLSPMREIRSARKRYSRARPDMRFLANENFPGLAVAALQRAGHDVVWVRITKPGATDPEVLAWAVREERILLTFDKEFGELASKSVLPPGCGVVLVRTPMPKPGDNGQRLADL